MATADDIPIRRRGRRRGDLLISTYANDGRRLPTKVHNERREKI
jgi:hypothetical protein